LGYNNVGFPKGQPVQTLRLFITLVDVQKDYFRNMTMKFKSIFIFLISFLLLNCSDDDASSKNASISGSVAHHDELIHNATVYYRFDVTEFPGASPDDYDGSVIADSFKAHYEITGLKAGNYYLYAVGIDTSCTCEVKGGIPVIIKSGEENVTSNVPVTE